MKRTPEKGKNTYKKGGKKLKLAFKITACSCAGIIGVAAAAWDADWCSGISFVMILIGCGCGLFVALHELVVIRAFEQKEKEAIRYSAWKAEFFREIDKL